MTTESTMKTWEIVSVKLLQVLVVTGMKRSIFSKTVYFSNQCQVNKCSTDRWRIDWKVIVCMHCWNATLLGVWSEITPIYNSCIQITLHQHILTFNIFKTHLFSTWIHVFHTCTNIRYFVKIVNISEYLISLYYKIRTNTNQLSYTHWTLRYCI